MRPLRQIWCRRCSVCHIVVSVGEYIYIHVDQLCNLFAARGAAAGAAVSERFNETITSLIVL